VVLSIWWLEKLSAATEVRLFLQQQIYNWYIYNMLIDFHFSKLSDSGLGIVLLGSTEKQAFIPFSPVTK
jgi:hypothetical protein